MEPALAGALSRRDGGRVGQLASLLADAGRSANVERLYITARLPVLQVSRPPRSRAAVGLCVHLMPPLPASGSGLQCMVWSLACLRCPHNPGKAGYARPCRTCTCTVHLAERPLTAALNRPA